MMPHCDACGQFAPCVPTVGALLRVPDGWGVITTMFKVKGHKRVHWIGDKRYEIGSQGMGSAVDRIYLCPPCLGSVKTCKAYRIPPPPPVAEPAPYAPGKRKLEG
jgi:hypothetical protein